MDKRFSCVTFVACVLLANFALGQGSTSVNGAFGQRTLGGGINGRNSTMQSAQSGAGQVSGNERFLRENRQGAFVGADSADARSFMSQATGTGTMNFNTGLGNLGSLGGMQNQFNRGNVLNSGTNNQNLLRFPVVAVIENAKRPSSPQITTRLTSRFAKLPAMKDAGPIQIRVENRTAYLSGEVATPRVRELAAALAKLEPGISKVVNDLKVVSTAGSSSVASSKLDR